MGSSILIRRAKLIAGAKDGILFLMFNPGPRGTLLNDIIELASPTSAKYNPNLYIQGVVNQNPGTAKNPVVLFNRGDRIDANADVVLPAAIPGILKFWQPELLKLPQTHAMVHSKVVVIDPYGDHPVVMTGSHNMGPKASGVNDENLILIEGNGDLASQYAGKIMEIYSQYRWRESVQAQDGKPKWQGLADDDAWQIKDPSQPYDKRRLRELDFWFGAASPAKSVARASTGGEGPPSRAPEADCLKFRAEAKRVGAHMSKASITGAARSWQGLKNVRIRGPGREPLTPSPRRAR